MKVKLFIRLLLFIAALAGLASCKKDDPAANLKHYTSGVFVVNQGKSGGIGSITWYDPTSGETVQDVFGRANGNAGLGEFAQSLALHNGKGYIVVNGANKIYVVDAETMQFQDSIGGLTLPRYLLPLDNDVALVSQWGVNGLDGTVVKIDLHTLKPIQAVKTGNGPEKMIRQADGLIAVPNSGGFGVDSSVSILNPNTLDEVSRTVVPGKNPSVAALALLPGNPASPNTFVYCPGSFFDATPQGWVGALSSGAGISHTTPPYGYDLVASPDGKTLYFAGNGNIYALDGGGLRVLFQQKAFGLACDPKTGYLYCADAKSFDSAGEVVIYKPDGTKIGSFSTGIGPGQMVFIP